jgi:HEAT repeat protein
VYDPAEPPKRALLTALADVLRGDPDERVRAGAARALGLVLANERASEGKTSKPMESALIDALGDESKDVAAASADSLVPIGVPSRAVPALTRLLSDPATAEPARLALEAAGQDRSPEARREFARLLRAARQAVRGAISESDNDLDSVLEQSIAALGPHAACLTVSMLRADISSRSFVQSPLELMADRGVRAVARALSHRSPLVRERAAVMLASGDERSAAALPYLVAATRDEVPAVRCAAALAIGQVVASERTASERTEGPPDRHEGRRIR